MHGAAGQTADGRAATIPAVIATMADLEAGLAALLAANPRLAPIAEIAGPLPLRRHAPGFAGLARIVCGQQLSTASAAAIYARLEAAGGDTPAGFLALDAAALRAAGLSLGKMRTLTAVAAAVDHPAKAEAAPNGAYASPPTPLDLEALATMPAEAAHAALTAFPGIGPWTVELYLLFCAGHPDVFPAGDLALQVAVADAMGLDGRPSAKALAALAAGWAPWRAVAARLFWAYYRARRGTAGVPV